MDDFGTIVDKLAPGTVLDRLAINDELFWEPDRLVQFEHWVGHIPFAFWLVRKLRPRMLVELGTHRGNSYCAFCQAIAVSQLDSRAYAIDAWQGDQHMAFEPGLLDDLKRYHDPRYSAFSTLMPMPFQEARQFFADQSIDLLHIDGTHTYEAVRADFETWKSAVSDRGVVLFHDTAVRRQDYGVWRLWAELAQDNPHFEFYHSSGLGVLGLGRSFPAPVSELFAMSSDPAASRWVRSLFGSRGQAVTLRLARETLEAGLSLAQAEAGSLRHEHDAMRAELAEARHACARLRSRLLEFEAAQTKLSTLEALQTKNAALKQALDSAHAGARVHVLEARKQLQTAHAHIEVLERQNRESLLNCQAWERQYSSIASATFWRATYPLRRVVEGIERLGRQTRLRLSFQHAGLQASPDHAVAPPRRIVVARDSGFRAGSSDEIPPEVPDMFVLKTAIPRGRIAVVLHLYYSELWDEYRDAIAAISEPFDLFVTLTAGHSDNAVDWIRQSFPSAYIFVFPNRGRDLFPFVALVNAGMLFRYSLVCKLQTKRSLHREDGDDWRLALTGGILQSSDLIERIVRAFDSDADLGIVSANGSVLGWDSEYWISNLDRVNELLARVGAAAISQDTRFPAGSVFWIRPFLLRTIAALKLTIEDFEPEPLAQDGTTAHAVERIIGVVCYDSGMKIVETSALPTSLVKPPASHAVPLVHLIAFYLPQFHPIAENDAWWGKGFTEWTFVTRAQPQYRGHRQPRLPSDLGFYDLRVPEVRQAQAGLARSYGLSAFCYHYYWFSGRSLLRGPLDEVLRTGQPDFPFLLCWANEPWTRNWDGLDQEVLLAQDYGDGWARAFARDIAPVLRDRRYFRLSHKPVLLIYRPMNIPDRLAAFAELRRALMQLEVGPVHLAGGLVTFQGEEPPPDDPDEIGLDAYFEFPPLGLNGFGAAARDVSDAGSRFAGRVYDYHSALEGQLGRLAEPSPYQRHRSVMACWDNTPRRGGAADIFQGGTPANFRRWLRGVVRHERRSSGPSERMVFINAWNEWAEGTYLEPDQDFGHGWLEAVASAAGLGLPPSDRT